MAFLRTVTGDIDAAEAGVCYSHEHIIIDPSFTTFCYPDFLLDSVDLACADVQEFRAAGGRTLVDSMPCGGGRNPVKLAEVATRTGVSIVCPTGLHLQKYYPPGHWGEHLSAEEMAELFVAEIEEGIDVRDYNGPTILRSLHRAGVIKVATSGERPTPHERKVIEAAVIAHRQTGAPILVGRSARDNDALTLRVARGNDLWLHTRDVQGAHVIVPGAGESPDARTLADAALLAVHFSSARGQDGAEVAWTHRKHVRKPKGAAPGSVVVTQEKVLRVRLEEDRLEVLLRTEA